MACLSWLAACTAHPPGPPIIGEAYASPAVLNIRADIPPQSKTVASVKHGDRLVIIQRKRSFLKVRTEKGAEGWTDERQLLGADDMAMLHRLDQAAAKLVSQGTAVADDELNVHMLPSTKSPTVVTLRADDRVDVLAHVVRPRVDIPRQPLIPPPSKKQTVVAKKALKRQPGVPPPPMPEAPALPANWLELSKSSQPQDSPAPAPPPVITDDWSLIRTSAGQLGWVLTRRVRMAVPDEIGQYAEGHRVVSYFAIGGVQDGDKKKDTWLWTTVSGGQPGYDFDSLRVFAWSIKRHRYETQHIEKNLRGYLPVLIGSRQNSGSRESPAGGEPNAGFSVCVEKKDGLRYRRSYSVVNSSVRVAGEAPCEAAPNLELAVNASPSPSGPAPDVSSEGLFQRVKKRVKAIFHH